jgi:hypothetical protein
VPTELVRQRLLKSENRGGELCGLMEEVIVREGWNSHGSFLPSLEVTLPNALRFCREAW